METLNVIYWCRVGLGIIAGLICVAGWALTTTLITSVIQGVSLAIIFYIITYYLLKMKFIAKVEKTSKLFRQGIGTYFLTWIISWSLFISLTVPIAVFVYSGDPKVGVPVTFDATGSYDIKGYVTTYTWIFAFSNGTVSNETVTHDPILAHTFAVQDSYKVLLYVTDNDGLTSSPKAVTIEITS